MDLMSSRGAMWLRGIARRLRLKPLAARLAFGRKREERFAQGLVGAARPGDVCWDVGAFRGRYSRKLAEKVGPEGRVYAFEPNPLNFATLAPLTAQHPQVTALPLALGARPGTVPFRVSGGRSRVMAEAAPGLIEVELSTGDAVLAAGRAAAPNVLKIDTEGLELEVIEGMSGILAAPTTRGIFIEVHFEILQERGADHVPGELVRRLRDAGYGVSWIDPSHLAAVRSG